MKVGIYLNRKYFSENAPYIERIRTAFEEKSCKVISDGSELDGVDILFVLGGDGTILTVAADCAKRGVRIIGINYGHLGFLAEFERDKLDEAIALVKGGAYKVQSRSMLKAVCGGREYLALNDVVIQRHTSGVNFSNTVNLHAAIDGVTVDNFSADGIIVSTPTGSTAYSLAAGGSVLTPDIEAFILTPVCAHSLHSRPVVFGDKSQIKISPEGKCVPLALVVDGTVVDEVSCGDEITVSKAANTVEFITKDDKNFFNKLLIKLSIWSK